MDFKTTHAEVWAALRTLYDQDRDLLVAGPHPQPEQAVTFRFAHYLAAILERSDHRMRVDCEYRRAGEQIKGFAVVDEVGQTVHTNVGAATARVAPDVIVHRRRTNSAGANLLVIECKASDGHRDSRSLQHVGRRVDLDDHARLSLFTGRVRPGHVRLDRGDFRVDLGSERPAGSRWLHGQMIYPYRFGVSLLFAPSGVRVTWYSGVRPNTDPVTEIADAKRDRQLVAAGKPADFAGW